jgi:hypothetical protein
LALILAASDVDAVRIALSVLLFTADVIPDVCALVFEFTVEAILVDAVVTSESVAREPEVRPAPVRVRVADDQTSAASVPKVVSVRLPAAQTFAGILVIDDASCETIDDDAVATILLVFALMTAASDEVAVKIALFVFELTALVIPDVCALVLALILAASDVDAVRMALSVLLFTADVIPDVWVLVFEFTVEAILVDAVVTSESVAREPEVRPAPVRVRVADDQTSAASVPKVVSVRLPAAQTFAGILVIDDASCETIDDDAVATILLVFALMTAASDEVAVKIALFVFELTALVIPDVCALVLALILAASDVDAVRIALSVLLFTADVIPDVCALVFEFTVEAILVDAVVTSESVAREPAVRPAPVRVRVADDQTSAASVPKVVSVRLPAAQTFAGILVIDDASCETIDDDAVATILLVFALMTAASDEVAVKIALFVFELTALVIPDVCALVLALILAASDVDAVRMALSVLLFTADVIPDVWVLVFEFTVEAILVDAVVTSESVAREPEVRPAPVRVRVADDQTSAASVPKVVSVRLPAAQTFAGILVIDDASCETIDDDAVATILLVFALMTAASDEVAVKIALFVFELTALVIPDVCALVLALILAASDVDAVRMALSVLLFTADVIPDVWVLVFEFTVEAILVDAVVTSESVAREPAVRPAPVRVRVADDQTSAASVPKVVSVRVPEAHISATNVPKEDSVLAL